jgi:hypothetical protein
MAQQEEQYKEQIKIMKQLLTGELSSRGWRGEGRSKIIKIWRT